MPNALPGDTANWQIPNTKYTITGHSRAGERTGFCIKSLGVFFDAGLSAWCPCKYIFISHSHTDHSFALPMMIATLDTPAEVYVPQEAIPMFENHLQATAQLNACSLEPQDIPCNLNGVQVRDQLRITVKSIKWIIDVKNCPHRVPSVSYCISEVRQKLKEELKGKPSKEIAAIRKAGGDVVEESIHRLFVFMGDTTTEAFDLHPELFDYPVIFVECTLWTDGMEEMALARGHIHWTKLKPIIQAHPNCLFMLIHFTLRHDEKEIRTFFENESTTHQITNFGLWLDSGVVVFSDLHKDSA